MNTALIDVHTRPLHLDALLQEVCATLQITDTQYKNAESKYEAVGAWLAERDSPIATLKPLIYPQGSMALQTTVKPRVSEEYDLDLVLQVEAYAINPMWLYSAVLQRLSSHGEYAKKIEPKNRCIRLNYAGQFHLDILPARIDLDLGGTYIEVPDRKMGSWKPSNPRGYKQWFEGRCAEIFLLEKRTQIPLPDNTDADLKAILKRAVQLIKRRRDVFFGDDVDSAPRSIVLTTLAGHHYHGEPVLSKAVLGILDGILATAAAASPTRIRVQNPANSGEWFCEAWNETTYNKFVDFVVKFRNEMVEIVPVQGLDNVGQQLKRMFGEVVGDRAIKNLTERMSTDRDNKALRVTSTGLTTSLNVGRSIPKHTFYGK